VTKLLDERERKRVEDARQLDERRTQNVRLFTERVEAAESLRVLSESHGSHASQKRRRNLT
jgi:hypothetical protein